MGNSYGTRLVTASVLLILFVFNLMPLPPLDGSQVVVLLLDESFAERYSRIIHQPALRIVGLIIAWNVVGFVLSPVHLLAINILYFPNHSYH